MFIGLWDGWVFEVMMAMSLDTAQSASRMCPSPLRRTIPRSFWIFAASGYSNVSTPMGGISSSSAGPGSAAATPSAERDRTIETAPAAPANNILRARDITSDSLQGSTTAMAVRNDEIKVAWWKLSSRPFRPGDGASSGHGLAGTQALLQVFQSCERCGLWSAQESTMFIRQAGYAHRAAAAALGTSKKELSGERQPLLDQSRGKVGLRCTYPVPVSSSPDARLGPARGRTRISG